MDKPYLLYIVRESSIAGEAAQIYLLLKRAHAFVDPQRNC